MTDVRTGGETREVLFEPYYYLDLTGVVREVLVSSAEAPPPETGGNTAVTVNTG